MPAPIGGLAAIPAAPAGGLAPPALPAAPPARPRWDADGLALSPAARAAREGARAVSSYAGPAEVSEAPFYRVERDPRDANANSAFDRVHDGLLASARGLTPAPYSAPTRTQQASALVEARAAAERQALVGWDGVRELRYLKLKELLAGQPMAQLAWQTLLLTGQLAKDARPAADGKPLYDHLTALLVQPLAPGLDRRALLAGLVQEVADPACIDQGLRNTCTVASSQILLAGDRAAEYVRLVAGLAAPDGRVATVGGTPLVRPALAPDFGQRTPSAALFEAACMDLGNGDFPYDDAHDTAGPGGLLGPTRGLGGEELGHVLGALFGGRWTYEAADTRAQGGLLALLDSANRTPPATLLAQIARITAAGTPVVCDLTWAADPSDPRAAKAAHAVLVTAVTPDRVTICNPHGTVETLTASAFTARVRGFHREAHDPFVSELSAHGATKP